MEPKRRSLDTAKRVRGLVTAGLVITVLLFSFSLAAAQSENRWFVMPLFTQQDTVQAFDLVTGKGYQIGTATGKISGTTFVEFQLSPTGPPVGDVLPISFQNKVIITDVDGDQIFFDNNGTGSFHLGVPDAEFKGSGGPLIGTYIVTGGTGKYESWTVGTTYRYRAIMSNPPNPANALGTVYAEVSRYKIKP